MTGIEMYERFIRELSEKGVTKKEFCEIAGISQGTLSNWGKRGTMPSSELVLLMANFLGCSTDYLLGNTNIRNADSKDKFELTSKEAELIEKFRNSTDEEKQFIMQYFVVLKK